jgi:hypothetical protein
MKLSNVDLSGGVVCGGITTSWHSSDASEKTRDLELSPAWYRVGDASKDEPAPDLIAVSVVQGMYMRSIVDQGRGVPVGRRRPPVPKAESLEIDSRIILSVRRHGTGLEKLQNLNVSDSGPYHSPKGRNNAQWSWERGQSIICRSPLTRLANLGHSLALSQTASMPSAP